MKCKHDEKKLLIAQAGDEDEGAIIYVCKCNKMIMGIWVAEKEVAFYFNVKKFKDALNKLVFFGNNGGMSA